MFRFKQFGVLNEGAAFKVGTDAVLLGAAVTLPCSETHPGTGMQGSALRILDIGTGTGVIGLCIAQRLSGAGADFTLTGIDIDPPSVEEARKNFSSSPWADRLEARCVSLSDFESGLSVEAFDLIVSNPPYFEESLRNPDPRESAARHTDLLSYRDIARFASSRLRPSGRLAMILPASCEVPLRRISATFSLRAERILRVRTTSRKAPCRIVAQFVLSEGPCLPASEEEIVILDGGTYTEEYRDLTSPFYL